jgi:hypothetical protein
MAGKAYSLRVQLGFPQLVWIGAALAGLLGPARLYAGDFGIQIPAVQPTTASSMSFSIEDWDAVTQDELLRLSPQTSLSNQQRFILGLDLGSFSRDGRNRFQFDLYLQKTGAAGAERFHVTEYPVGVFTDYLASIQITIQSATASDSATLTAIPIHALYEGPLFSLGGDGSPFPVQLGGVSPIAIPMTSNLSDLPVTINQVTVSSTTCKACWLVQPAATSAQTVQPKGSASMILAVQPNTIHALFTSAFAVDPRKAHDTLAVYITGTPGQGGLTSLPQQIDVPVRFTPSFIFLASAVIVGALIGFGIRRLIPMVAPAGGAGAPDAGGAAGGSQQGPRGLVRDLVLSIATAAVVEVVGLILFNTTNTSVVVFGFSLDPSQVAPAFLVATLVAGGPPVVARIKDAIKI